MTNRVSHSLSVVIVPPTLEGERLDYEQLVNTWERDARGEFAKAVVETVDPDTIELDPLTVL